MIKSDVKLKDCDKVQMACTNCGSKDSIYDKVMSMHKCVQCGRKVRFEYKGRQND